LPFYLLIPEAQNWPTFVCADGLEGKHPWKGQVVRFLARAIKCEVILRAAYLLLQQESLRLYGKILSGKKCEVRIICTEMRLASKASSLLDRVSLDRQYGGGCAQVAPGTLGFWPELHFCSAPIDQAQRREPSSKGGSSLHCPPVLHVPLYPSQWMFMAACRFWWVRGAVDPVTCGQKLVPEEGLVFCSFPSSQPSRGG